MNKRTLILSIVFILLGVIVYIQETERKQAAVERPPELGLMFPGFDEQAVMTIEYRSFGGSVKLIKDNDKWFVDDDGTLYPADTEAVEKALETTRDLEAVQVISKDPSKHVTFQVNSAQQTTVAGEDGEAKPFTMGTMGTEVVFMDATGNELVHFYIGKNGKADFMSTYVRKEGADEVLLANGYLKMIYGKGSAAAWKDLVICELPPEDIASIRLGSGDDAIILRQVPDESVQSETPVMVWEMTKPDRGRIESPMLQRVTGMFRRFRASDFAETVEDEKTYGFDAPTAVVAVTPVEGEERVFVFGAATDDTANQYYFKEEGKDQVYVLPKYRLESVQKSPDDFFEES